MARQAGEQAWPGDLDDADEDDADELWCRQVEVLRGRVEAWTGNHCQVYEVDGPGLYEHAARAEPIVAEWRTDVLPLFGEDLRRILGLLGTSPTTRQRRVPVPPAGRRHVTGSKPAFA